MADNEVAKRIKFLMKELNYRQVDFAQKIDVDTSNLSKYLNGRLAMSDALINKIVVNLGVSKQWLETGEDLPFAKQQPQQLITMPESRIVTEPTKALVKKGTPVYDIDVTAGYQPQARMFTDDQIIGFVDLPDMTSTNCRIVRVSGDSMSPVIRSGDYIAVRELSNLRQIFWGQIYVVILDDYRLVKYVRRHDDPSMVILRSENRRYDDMEIDRADIRDLMFVQNIIHVDTRM
ncbi:MAG: LexA family transcriptional regulator [Muribaculaceae bacterium]|nr:LexA family transcriptional regulator [Muribaculaceae bacterium]MBQ5509092.1 LexA family transcriptional regulator [Muribaculaceae bacterium]